jgi:hypothetical protein
MTLLVVAAAFVFSTGTIAAADDSGGDNPLKTSACEGLSQISSDGCNGGGNTLSNTVKVIVNILTTIVGVIAVIMIIIGGAKYVTSGGDSAKVASAKSSIIYAIVGLIIVALAQVIVHFVIHTAIPNPKTGSAAITRETTEQFGYLNPLRRV